MRKRLFLPELDFVTEDDEFTSLVKWTLMHVNEAINEGIPVYAFVEENLQIVRISGLIFNNDAGYFIVPDKTKGTINFYFFKSIYFNTTQKPYSFVKNQIPSDYV